MKPDPASVPQHRIKWWRQRFGWSRKEELYCFSRQRGPQWANALTTVCPDLDGVVKSFMVMVPRGRDQLMDSFWLVGGEVSGSQHRQPSGSKRLGSCLWAAYLFTVNFSYLMGVLVSAKQLKDIVMYIPGGGTRTLPQGITMDCSSLISASPLFLN